MGFPFDSDVPDVVLEHAGVTFYYCFNGDEVGAAHETYEFSLNAWCGNRTCRCGGPCRFVFDVRILPNYREPLRPLTSDEPGSHEQWNIDAWRRYFDAQPEYHREVILIAIDLKYLTPDGLRLPQDVR